MTRLSIDAIQFSLSVREQSDESKLSVWMDGGLFTRARVTAITSYGYGDPNPGYAEQTPISRALREGR